MNSEHLSAFPIPYVADTRAVCCQQIWMNDPQAASTARALMLIYYMEAKTLQEGPL